MTGWRKAAVMAAVAVASAAAVGCADESDPEPSRRSSEAARSVAETVARLERAVRGEDYATVCARLMTAEARRRSGGAGCPRTLRESARDVRDPAIRLISVSLRGDAAEARIRTTARGQAPVDETLRLVARRGGYRIVALDR